MGELENKSLSKIIFHQQDNYGVPQLTFVQNIKGLILIGGEKDLRGNLNLWTC